MWDALTDLAESVWDGVTGAASGLWNGFKWGFYRLFGIRYWLALFEFIGSFFGLMPEKKLRLAVKILIDDDKVPVASRAAVDDVVSRAQRVFKDVANVRIVSVSGSDRLIVGFHPEPAPEDVMSPRCNSGGFWQTLTPVGRWFARRVARTPAGTFFGYGRPATIFIVKNVQDKNGCFLGPIVDYGFIDPEALSKSLGGKADTEGQLLTFAHELGHACDLIHVGNGKLMERDGASRTARLGRFQRAILRTSPRVTYF